MGEANLSALEQAFVSLGRLDRDLAVVLGEGRSPAPVADLAVSAPRVRASELINFVDTSHGGKTPKLIFVDARPPNSRSDRRFCKHLLPLEAWCHFIFRDSNAASTRDTPSSGEQPVVVFVWCAPAPPPPSAPSLLSYCLHPCGVPFTPLRKDATHPR